MRNLVSLSVAAVYVVLAITGLMIYLGQGNYFSAKHLHAWFGILFFAVSVFHIVNNWSSLKHYSVNRKSGSLRRELALPIGVSLLFLVGIAANWPVFKDLANAGKRAFGPAKKTETGLSQPAVDSIARKLTIDYTQAISQHDTALVGRILSKKSLVSADTENLIKGASLSEAESVDNRIIVTIEQATALDDHVIVASGTTSRPVPSSPLRFTNVLNEQDGVWRIAALHITPLSAKETTLGIK